MYLNHWGKSSAWTQPYLAEAAVDFGGATINTPAYRSVLHRGTVEDMQVGFTVMSAIISDPSKAECLPLGVHLDHFRHRTLNHCHTGLIPVE